MPARPRLVRLLLSVRVLLLALRLLLRRNLRQMLHRAPQHRKCLLHQVNRRRHLLLLLHRKLRLNHRRQQLVDLGRLAQHLLVFHKRIVAVHQRPHRSDSQAPYRIIPSQARDKPISPMPAELDALNQMLERVLQLSAASQRTALLQQMRRHHLFRALAVR